MAKRPALHETDEDTLKLQEEFLLEKGKDGLLKSIKENQENEEEKEDFSSQVLDAFEAIPIDHSLKIYERREGGEPPPKHYKEQRRKGTSIFSQRMQKTTKPKDEPMDVTEFVCPQQKSSTIISMELPENEKERIHQENVKVMQEMTEEEILEERQRLLDMMDPAIANFLKSKRKVNQESSTIEIDKQNEAARNVNIDDLEAPNEVMEVPGAEKWLNFDQVEVGKLAWMSKMDIPQLKEGGEYHARFDFKGFILPFTLPEINESNRSLYHHGDEPGRPGYTLQELFQLCRSSVNQQRIVALNTIANILSVYQYGIYDDVIDIPLEQIFFMLRISLDDNTPAVLNASVKAIRNLFFYIIDETCLDNLLGYGLGTVQPILAIDEEIDDDTVNDQQLAETNLVKCLMRTNIFNRMRYIVNTLKPATETIMYCIEILTRLARDSNFVVQKMLDCRDLLDAIVQYFTCPIKTSRKTSDYEYPLVQAVKLFRILACRSHKFAVELVNRHKIMDSVASYLTNEDMGLNVSRLELQNEAIHMWSVLLLQDLALDYFRELEGTILKNFHRQIDYTALQTTFTNQKHISALVKLITIGLNKNLFGTNKEQVAVILRRATEKWTAQFCNLESFSCGLLQINSSLFKFRDLEDVFILSLLKSKGFLNVTRNIRAGSNFLSQFKCHKSSSNLKCIEAAVWEGKDHIIPVLCCQSCIPFLRVLSEVVVNSTSNEVKLQFLNNPNLEKYIHYLNAAVSFNLTNNWFTKLETQLIINILKSSVAVQNSIDTSVFYEIAVKCLSTFNSQQNQDIEFIFRYIIFSTKFYPCSALLKHLDVTDDNNLLKKALINLDHIFNVYTKVLNIKPENEVGFAVDATEGNVIPFDWIYSPIVLLYSNKQDSKEKLKEEEQIYITKNCLYWIYIYETYFPKLASLIDPTDRFCRLACTFLVSDLFLNFEIKDLLVAGLKNLLRSIDKINFDKPIQGLSNFQDFYVQLLEHYQADSCRDILFGNFILLPLMQRHNKVYRDTLWSEYSGVVEVFNVSQQEVMSPIEMYLNPHENDTKLLRSYKIALMKKLHPNSFLHQIARHHIKEYMISKKVCPPPFLNKNIHEGT